jgi:cobalt/nickel transport system permease protein
MQDLYLARQSLFHQMDARVKFIFVLVFVLLLNLTPTRSWAAYGLFLFTLYLSVVFSRVGFGFLLKRSLLALPFVLAALPMILSGPAPFAVLNLWSGAALRYSPEGVLRFVSVLLKSWISVQAAILLTATTRFPDLLAALQQLRAPRLFVAIIGLMWRYLFVMGEEVTRMLRARASRSAWGMGAVRTGGGIIWRAKVTGGMAGSLFLRSIERSDRVYAAMLSRGYNGELPQSENEALGKQDRIFLFLGCFLLLFLWSLGVMTGN